MVVCGFLLGAAGQVVKLCADTAMQIDVDDALRGHVFAVQDALFWMSFIVAITVAARLSFPPTAARPRSSLAGSAVYLVGLAVHASVGRRAASARAKVTGMATAGPIVADLRAESDELDALVAELPADALGGRHSGAGLDHRPPDRPSAVDRPGRADCRSPTRPGSPTVLGAAAADPTGFVDRGAEEIAAAAPAELLADWRRHPHAAARRAADACPTAASCRGSGRR